MIRVLQLLDLSAGIQSARGSASLTHGLGEDFDVSRITIGPGGTHASGLAAATALRGAKRDFDIIHAWGARALTVAALTWRGRILFSPADVPTPHSISWAKAIAGYRSVDVICPTTTLRRAFVERGIPFGHCHLIRPGVDFAALRRKREPGLRAALGFSDADRVMLLAGESIPASGHREGIWAASVLYRLDARYRVLIWGRGSHARATLQFASRMGTPRMVVSAEQQLRRSVEFEELLPQTDLVVVSATGLVPTLPISICMAGALPIIATVSSTVSELLEDRHTALMCGPDSPKALARRVLDMEEDANLRWSLADMARTEAYEYFSQTRFLDQYRTAYRQAAAGGLVDIPEPAPGAGLRFHGRG